MLNPDRTNIDFKDTFIPSVGDLRFVSRNEHNATNEFVRTSRILQRFEWCFTESIFGWFDVSLESEE